MSCRRQVAIRLCAMPTYFAPTSVQQKSQLLMGVLAGPIQHTAQRRVQQAVLGSVGRKLVKLRKKTVAPHQVRPQMLRHLRKR